VSRPLLLDLFCCQGGAAMGYHRAGFDVVGVDLEPQPRYPFRFFRGDAIGMLRTGDVSGFSAIHASPPCHDHVRTFVAKDGSGHLLADTRELLEAVHERWGVPWIIENVPGAPMRADYELCGCMFPELKLLARKRWFETSWQGFEMRPPCHHPERPVTVTGNGIPSRSYYYGRVDGYEYHRLSKEAMGINWMTKAGLVQAIPPAYTEHIGLQLREHLAVTA
jgi:DNA (cytosine-5)-methyltransferase 1